MWLHGHSLNGRDYKKDLKGHREGERKRGDENEMRTKQSLTYHYPLKEKGIPAKGGSIVNISFPCASQKSHSYIPRSESTGVYRDKSKVVYSSHGVLKTVELLKCCGFWTSSKRVSAPALFSVVPLMFSNKSSARHIKCQV